MSERETSSRCRIHSKIILKFPVYFTYRIYARVTTTYRTGCVFYSLLWFCFMFFFILGGNLLLEEFSAHICVMLFISCVRWTYFIFTLMIFAHVIKSREFWNYITAMQKMKTKKKFSTAEKMSHGQIQNHSISYAIEIFVLLSHYREFHFFQNFVLFMQI